VSSESIPTPEGRAGPAEFRASVRADLANALVRLNRELYGRGPTKAKAYVNEDVVVVVMEDALSQVERSLLAEGEADAVGYIREHTGEIKREPFVEAVERITGRRVRGFVTGFNLEPPMVIDTFALEPEAP
jgi:uncharacterized protein YbcI